MCGSPGLYLMFLVLLCPAGRFARVALGEVKLGVLAAGVWNQQGLIYIVAFAILLFYSSEVSGGWFICISSILRWVLHRAVDTVPHDPGTAGCPGKRRLSSTRTQ